MIYEFEGKTEKDAIDKAVAELGISRDSFDVEILEAKKGGLFTKGLVKIRVHTDDGFPGMDGESPEEEEEFAQGQGDEYSRGSGGRRRVRGIKAHAPTEPEPQTDFEKELVAFIQGLVERMGYQAKINVQFRERGKIGLEMVSRDSPILIGRKGKTLDALQLLAMIYAGAHGQRDMKVILDTENYRQRREESLVQLALNMAARVRSSRGSILLEPMNPFDRRIIHTALSDAGDVGTESEGEGLYKQVRIFYNR
jgi:spoIIIJ-associated protein